jgi:hypothetical protein
MRPPIFAAWLAIRYRGPVCERWGSFVNFYCDVGRRPSWRHLVIRNDTSREFSRENARWQPARVVSLALAQLEPNQCLVVGCGNGGAWHSIRDR